MKLMENGKQTTENKEISYIFRYPFSVIRFI